METALSVHPYFRIHEGQDDAVRALLPEFAARTGDEDGCVYYEFFATAEGDFVYCREAYRDAAAFQAHLENVGDLLGKLLEHCTVERLEIHGSPEDVESARQPLADLNPQCFTYLCGVKRRV